MATAYDNLGSFLAGEEIPSEFHEYFDEYDPAQEELLTEKFGVDQRKARFQFGQDKRKTLSQTAKMGFAGSGELQTQQANLFEIFADEQGLMGSQFDVDVADTKADWLNAQFDMATSMADDIEAAKRSAPEIAKNIHASDSHWAMKHLDDYYSNSNERKFLRYADSIGTGAGGMEDWKKARWNDGKELRQSFNKRKSTTAVQSLGDPGT